MFMAANYAVDPMGNLWPDHGVTSLLQSLQSLYYAFFNFQTQLDCLLKPSASSSWSDKKDNTGVHMRGHIFAPRTLSQNLIIQHSFLSNLFRPKRGHCSNTLPVSKCSSVQELSLLFVTQLHLHVFCMVMTSYQVSHFFSLS